MNKKSGKKTLLWSVIMSSPGPLIVGLCLIVGQSYTQIADFVRRSIELMAIVLSFVVYCLTTKNNYNDEVKKQKLEARTNSFVSMAMIISGIIMILMALFLPSEEKGNVIPGLAIAILGVVANSIFWIRYSKLGKVENNMILKVQSKLYRAKTFVDCSVTISLLVVLFSSNDTISNYFDIIGTCIVSLYMIYTGICSIRANRSENKLYKKSETWFAIIWIIIYCVLASIGDVLSEEVGFLKSITLPILIVISIIIYLFVKINGLSEKYGLCKPKVPAHKMLFYIPLIILLTANFWNGFSKNVYIGEAIFYILSMFCVGFIEEMIFRGFLFKAMEKNGVKSAIIVSSITFGIGHIINLFNGSGTSLLPNILQVIYAIAVGFAFVMIFYKTKSLYLCIVTHGLFNATSIFANESEMSNNYLIISSILIAVIAILYGLYITFFVKDKKYNKLIF